MDFSQNPCQNSLEVRQSKCDSVKSSYIPSNATSAAGFNFLQSNLFQPQYSGKIQNMYGSLNPHLNLFTSLEKCPPCSLSAPPNPLLNFQCHNVLGVKNLASQQKNIKPATAQNCSETLDLTCSNFSFPSLPESVPSYTNGSCSVNKVIFNKTSGNSVAVRGLANRGFSSNTTKLISKSTSSSRFSSCSNVNFCKNLIDHPVIPQSSLCDDVATASFQDDWFDKSMTSERNFQYNFNSSNNKVKENRKT